VTFSNHIWPQQPTSANYKCQQAEQKATGCLNAKILNQNTKMSIPALILLQPFYILPRLCPGLPGWAGTRKVKLGRKNQSVFTAAKKKISCGKAICLLVMEACHGHTVQPPSDWDRRANRQMDGLQHPLLLSLINPLAHHILSTFKTWEILKFWPHLLYIYYQLQTAYWKLGYNG